MATWRIDWTDGTTATANVRFRVPDILADGYADGRTLMAVTRFEAVEGRPGWPRKASETRRWEDWLDSYAVANRPGRFPGSRTHGAAIRAGLRDAGIIP